MKKKTHITKERRAETREEYVEDERRKAINIPGPRTSL